MLLPENAQPDVQKRTGQFQALQSTAIDDTPRLLQTIGPALKIGILPR
jgi:hypothetical protein